MPPQKASIAPGERSFSTVMMSPAFSPAFGRHSNPSEPSSDAANTPVLRAFATTSGAKKSPRYISRHIFSEQPTSLPMPTHVRR